MCKILFIVLVFSLTIAEKADAFIWSFGGEKLIEVEDLPDTDEWLDEGGIYQDAYVIYKQAWILWIPILNWDARYVLSSESGGDLFYEFADPSDKDRIVSRHGPPSSAIPFWDKVGGKMVWVAIAVIFGFLKFAGGGKNNQDQTYSASSSVAATQTAGYGPPPSVTNTPIPPALTNPDVIYISRGGQQYGPYSSEQTRAMLSSGDLSGSDQAWYEGAQGWMPLNQVPGIT